jgi:hypothetical protein
MTDDAYIEIVEMVPLDNERAPLSDIQQTNNVFDVDDACFLQHNWSADSLLLTHL